MSGSVEVEADQVWESRDGARQVHVVTVHGDPTDPGSWVLVSGRTTRRMRLATLTRRYRLWSP